MQCFHWIGSNARPGKTGTDENVEILKDFVGTMEVGLLSMLQFMFTC